MLPLHQHHPARDLKVGVMFIVIYNLTMSLSDGSPYRDIVTVIVIFTLNAYLAVTIIIIYLLFLVFIFQENIQTLTGTNTRKKLIYSITSTD